MSPSASTAPPTRAKKSNLPQRPKGTKLGSYHKPALGDIDIAKSYPIERFSELSGMDKSALKEAKKRGLRVTKVGKRKYIRGADWDAFLGSLPADS